MVEVSCGEYGAEYVDRMVQIIENGKCYNWTPDRKIRKDSEAHLLEMQMQEEIDPKYLRPKSTGWEQFCILYIRRTKQMLRDSVNVLKAIYMLFFY